MTPGKTKSLERIQKAPESASPSRAFARRLSAGIPPGEFDPAFAPQMAGNLAVQRFITPGSKPGPASIPSGTHLGLLSSGHPLSPGVRQAMESRLGRDLSDVRVHTDGRAAEAARAIDARAYTLGRDVVFGAGQYAPETRQGQHLIAHELTHVVQQSRGTTHPTIQGSDGGTSGDPLEREANRTADAVVSGGSVPHISQSTGVGLQRQPIADAGAPPAGAPTPAPAPAPATPAAGPTPAPGQAAGPTARDGGEIRQGRLGDIVILLPPWTIFDAQAKTKHWGDDFKDVKLAKIPFPEFGGTVDVMASGGAGANFAASIGPGVLRNIRIGLSYKQAALVLGGSVVGFILAGPAGYALGGIGALLLLDYFAGIADLEIRGRISLDANIYGELKAAAEALGAFEVGHIAAGLGARAGASFDISMGGTMGLYYQDRHLRFRFSEALDAKLLLFFSLFAYIKATILGFTWRHDWNLARKNLDVVWQIGSRLDMSYDNGITINIPELIESAQKAADFAKKVMDAASDTRNVVPTAPAGGKGGGPAPPIKPLGPAGPAPATAPTGTRSDPIEMIWNKPLSRYRNPVWLLGTPYYRDERQQLDVSKRWIGATRWPGRGDIVQRITTPRGNAADEFKKQLLENGFDDWDAYSPDHVVDLMFNGRDDFYNLWPLDRGTNERAGTWHWGQGVWFSEPNDPTPRQEAIGSTTLDGRYFKIKEVADPP